jgi:hypothetical protein
VKTAIDITAINLSKGTKFNSKESCEILVMSNNPVRNDAKLTAYNDPAIMWANQAIHPLMKALGRGNPSLTHKYPPPASGIADPSSAYAIAVKSVINALIIKATITALPARPIAGPVRTKIEPPTIAAIPTIRISKSPSDLTNWL